MVTIHIVIETLDTLIHFLPKPFLPKYISAYLVGMPTTATNRHVFFISFTIFVVLNTIENLIHYSIGREKDRNSYSVKIQSPSAHDWIKIIGVMTVFAVLQGLFTCLFTKCS